MAPGEPERDITLCLTPRAGVKIGLNATGRQKTVASQLRVGYPTHVGAAKTEILV